MAVATQAKQSTQDKWVSNGRRIYRWITTPQVVLSLIMLVVMFYMVIIPLYRMLMTTITVQESDLRVLRDGEVGEFTWFHWVRMLTSKIANHHDLRTTAAFADHLAWGDVLALIIGGLMAWMVVRTDMPGEISSICWPPFHTSCPPGRSRWPGRSCSKTRNQEEPQGCWNS